MCHFLFDKYHEKNWQLLMCGWIGGVIFVALTDFTIIFYIMEGDLNCFFIDLLKREVVPALGCTEPIAVSLAVAKAREVLGHEPEEVVVFVSPNIFKNGMGVGIPGTGKVGLHMAAALGCSYGNPSNGLALLAGVTPEAIAKANQLMEESRIRIDINAEIDKLYVEAVCRSGNHQSRVCIKSQHSNIVLVELDGVLLEGDRNLLKPTTVTVNFIPDSRLTIASIYEFATTVPFRDIQFLLEGAEMNRKIADEGLRGDYGLKIGKSLKSRVDRHLLSEDLQNYCVAMTTAASDARMAGHTLPAMSNSGSGNQGITVMLPVVAAADKLASDQESLARALAISNLVAIHIKYQMGRLGALCGVAAAAAASACGIVLLMGGDLEKMNHAIKNVVGNLTGMICDGAKVGCSLKVSSAVSASVSSALMAMDGICIQQTDGIVTEEVENTISNFARIGSDGMVETDKMIIELMLKKQG